MTGEDGGRLSGLLRRRQRIEAQIQAEVSAQRCFGQGPDRRTIQAGEVVEAAGLSEFWQKKMAAIDAEISKLQHDFDEEV
mmetsp:Transcript_19822/g.50084  ORF Transcript_19822/g.50084 Transcript_19822/m.50084 type:complete len:80 (-) Transcript_19822:344-583(-)